jgi:hypothetical protein
MKRFAPLFIFLATLGMVAKPALADDADARATASKLIDMTRGKESIRQGFDTVINGIISNMQTHGLPEAGVDEIKAAVDKWYTSEINFEEIRPKMVDVYVKDFSGDELKQILAFYQTPVGQKAIKEMPDVMREGATIAQDYTKAKIPDLNAALTPILAKYRDEMQGGPGDSTGGAPPSAPSNPTNPPGAAGAPGN